MSPILPVIFVLFAVFAPILLVLAVIFGGRHLTRKSTRILNGQCSECGYDMRGSTDACPECGTAKYRYAEDNRS